MKIEQWDTAHPRWSTLETMMIATNQRRYLDVHFEWHLEHFWFVALVDDAIVGLLHYARQYIGDDDDCQRVMLAGEALTEGKVMAFIVVEKYRRQGIGRSLQQAAINHAREQDCYQFRSYSDGDKVANHQLKLGMGFTVHPTVRGDDNAGAYFIMPLGGASNVTHGIEPDVLHFAHLS